MAHKKKSFFILVTAFIFMALISTGCERSYAPIDESLATPTVEGGEFPAELPSDMEGVFEAGAQTATAQAIEAAAPAAEEPTATPEGEDTELTNEDTPTEDTSSEEATEEAAPPTATNTLPVVEDPTEEPTQEPVDVNKLPANYTLKKGEFPYCIARRYNVNPTELLNLNNISSAAANSLQPGLTLKIPQSGNPFPYDRARNVHPVTYIVPATNTVYGIACYFGDVDPAAIMDKNPSISNPDLIAAGTSLQIP